MNRRDLLRLAAMTAAVSACDDGADITGATRGALRMPGGDIGLWDNFARGDRNLHGDTAPTGQVYTAQGSAAWIVGGRFVVDPAVPHVNPYRSALKYEGSATAPRVVAVDFDFSMGSTARQNVVVGSCAKDLARASVQLACWPKVVTSPDGDFSWMLFTVHKDPVTGSPVYNETLGRGVYAPLEYGRTYRSTIIRSGDGGTVSLILPDGTIRVITHPDLSAYWGQSPFVQIREQFSPTDGHARVSMFSAS